MSKKKSRVSNEKFYTFDIETTTLITGVHDDNSLERNAIIWSGQFYDGIIYKQTRDLKDTIDYLKQLDKLYSNSEEKLLIIVHNLSYEFQFIKDFFKWKKVLATDSRRIISVETEGLVFRCSYFLSNMNLEMFLKNENVPEEYQKSIMDYKVRRFPWTPLTPEEEIYCKNDVVGLHKAIEHILQNTVDNDLNNIPLTSTGYVRKDCREASRSNYKNRLRFLDEALTLEDFEMCNKAFRGGNTHANRFNSCKLMKDVFSIDETSAYIYELLVRKFPTKFYDMKAFTWKEFLFFLNNSDRWGMLIEFNARHIELKKGVAVPYIPVSKCKAHKIKADNGRILSCDFLTDMIITEQDYKIIMKQYKVKGLKISKVKYAKKKPIPAEIRKVIFDYFESKTKLKGVPDMEYFYSKKKNKLNSVYGMYVYNPIKFDYLFNPNNHMLEKSEAFDKQGLLNKYYYSWNNFLSYQVGVWVTAYARADLQEAIDLVRYEDFIYCDTDSVKALHYDRYKEAIQKINEDRIAKCKATNSFIKHNGKEYYLGDFDYEGTSKYFKTFGAKKYICGNSNDDFKITISGVPKKKGKERIKEAIKKGDFKNFYDIDLHFVFRKIKLTSEFNDYVSIHKFKFVDQEGIEREVEYGSNIAMYDANYTLGLTAEYEKLLFLFSDMLGDNNA